MPELHGRVLNNRLTDFDSLTSTSLFSTPATFRFKVSLCPINSNWDSKRFLESCLGILTSRRSWTQWQIPPQRIDRFQFCHLDIIGLNASYTSVKPTSLSHQYWWSDYLLLWVSWEGWERRLAFPGLHCRFLHSGLAEFDSLNWTSLGSIPATGQYKVLPCLINTHEITIYSGAWGSGKTKRGGWWSQSSITDSSTTA